MDARVEARALAIGAREGADECLNATKVEMKSGRWRCSACNKEYEEERRCNRHLLVHREKKFRCPHPGCAYKCAVNQMLTAHRRVHSNTKEFECRFLPCKQKFRVRGGRSYHERSTHLNVRRYKCGICHKPFVSDGGRREHEAAVHMLTSSIGNTMGGLCRKGCGRAFLKPSKLALHESKCLFEASSDSSDDNNKSESTTPTISSSALGGRIMLQVGDRVVDRVSLK